MNIPELPIHNQVLQHREFSATTSASFAADLTLKTQEGDLVQLSFASEDSLSQSNSQTQFDNNVTVQNFSSVAVAASRYSLEIQGELNEDEINAIRQLVAKISPIAQEFFTSGEFNLEETLSAFSNSSDNIQEIALTLEKTVVQTLTAQSFSRTGEGGETGLAGLFGAESGIDLSNIEDLRALVFAAIESEFEGQAILRDLEPSILRSLNDLMDFLEEQLGQFLYPLRQTPIADAMSLIEPPVTVPIEQIQ